MKCGKCKKESTPEDMFISRCDDCNKCDKCGTTDGLCHYVRGVFCKPCHKIHAQEKISEFQEKEKDTSYEYDVTCPHCGYVFMDSWEMSDEGTEKCGECDHEFIYYREISVTYSTSKV